MLCRPEFMSTPPDELAVLLVKVEWLITVVRRDAPPPPLA